jgi:ATP-binding cassette subfamily B protein
LRAIGGAQWVFDLLARKPQLAPDGGRRLTPIEGTVALERLRFNYPTRPDVAALADLDCTIAPGEVVAFVGHSGAGKSTILNLLLRFYDPDEGRVLIDGYDLRQIDAAWLRTQIGSVLQEPVLFSRSVGDNIRYGRPGAGDDLVEEAAEVACARGFVDQLPQRFATEIGDRGVQLSGGQRQRLAIARAVVRRPKILLLDEATSALDAENESLVLRALRSLDYKPTTLIVAHRLSTVVNVDRVAVLDRGRMVALGRHDELLQTSEFYRQLVETQLVAR